METNNPNPILPANPSPELPRAIPPTQSPHNVNAALVAVIIVLCLLLVGGGLYYFTQGKSASTPSPTPTPTSSLQPSLTPTAIPTVSTQQSVPPKNTTPLKTATPVPQPILPSASTRLPSSTSATSAIARAYIDAKGIETDYWFEYGTTSSFGQRTDINKAFKTSGEMSYSTSLYPLQPKTTYYYRVVARNVNGVFTGTTVNFTTK